MIVPGGADGSVPSTGEGDEAFESGEGGPGNGLFKSMSVKWGRGDGFVVSVEGEGGAGGDAELGEASDRDVVKWVPRS